MLTGLRIDVIRNFRGKGNTWIIVQFLHEGVGMSRTSAFFARWAVSANAWGLGAEHSSGA